MSEALQSPSSEHNSSRIAGISIEPLQVACVSRSLASKDSVVRVEKVDTPPCILLPRFAREPLRLQQSGPQHPRGSGDVWPPEANLSDDISQSPVVPLGLVWSALSRDARTPWSWTTPEDETQSATAAELIATAAAGVMPQESVSAPVLVIPNDLKMSRQQDILDACAELDLRVKLLWRPIAAALPWCKQHAEAVLKRHPGIVGSVGLLLVLHLGLDQFELTPLELVAHKVGRQRKLLPARRRPKVAALPSVGIDWLMSWGGSSVAVDWHRLWTTNEIKHRLQKPQTSLEQFLNRMPNASWRTQGASAWLPVLPTRDNLDDWLRRHHEARSDAQVLGVVVTGELATCLFSPTIPLWRHVLSTLGNGDIQRLLVDELIGDDGHSKSLLADGALTYAAMLANDEIPYLDTLPRLRTVTYLNGRPDWIDLLKEDDGWVDGGRTWQRPEPLRGLCIQEGRFELEVIVWHDEFETIRTLKREFREPVASDVAVQLEVAIEPAQGNARIDVVPTDTTSSLSTMRLEWNRMIPDTRTPAEFLGTLPTLFPPLLRRAGSSNRWRSARTEMEAYCRSMSYGTLARVVACLQQREGLQPKVADYEANATAISSDGEPGGSQPEVLDHFVEVVLSRLSEIKTGKERKELVRALAYSASAADGVQHFLASRLLNSLDLEQHELAACGWCLRDPEHIALFAERLLRVLRSSPTAINNWLKAFAEILRYRDEATRDMKNQLCEELTQRISETFKAENARRNFQMLFRNSCLCIVYLLRRRAFDDGYLAIGSQLQESIRLAFIDARDDLKRSRGIGGAINLPNLLQTMIDYVDRKGPPLLATGTGFQDLAS